MRSNIDRTAAGSRSLRGASNSLPDRGDALAHADAHRGETVLHAAMLHLAYQGADQASSAAPQRVTQCDRAAVDVDLLLIEAEEADARERLRGKRLVQLDECNVGRLQAGLLQRLERRRH